MIISIVIAVGVIIVLFVWAICSVRSGNDFRSASSEVTEGMSETEVVDIMGEPSFTKKNQDGSFEFVYEKEEWKGFVRGGTKIRRMEIVFSSSGKVISVGRNKNCDKSGW